MTMVWIHEELSTNFLKKINLFQMIQELMQNIVMNQI